MISLHAYLHKGILSQKVKKKILIYFNKELCLDFGKAGSDQCPGKIQKELLFFLILYLVKDKSLQIVYTIVVTVVMQLRHS